MGKHQDFMSQVNLKTQFIPPHYFGSTFFVAILNEKNVTLLVITQEIGYFVCHCLLQKVYSIYLQY
jgi:hypothetical protein